ncbi:MAG TPA: VWA domain-containing protein [Pyrinomonadaceae bacterium]|nr:VWA domain-containing protein [Pyrinomonadaceae bacterium]
MKFCVVFLLVLTTFNSGAVTQGQTPRRRVQQNAVSKPRSETVRICQGVPIPEGYVVIAYMTSSACSHGAYVLKKQDDYESSLAVNGSARPPLEKSAEPPKTTPAKTSRSTARPGAQPTQASRQSARNSTAPKTLPAQPGRDPASSAGASASATRPRRVGDPSQTTTQSQEPPALIGSEPAPVLAPPTLANPGTNPVASPTSASSTDVSAAGPEEVGEGDVVRVNTSLVTVPVSVLDRQGRFIANLQREDFQVFENGVEQSIAYFEPAEKPFTVALLLDTSPSTHFHLNEIKEAAIAFAKQLRPQDRVLIVSFNDEVLLLTEVTNDLHLIETVIEENVNTGNSTRLYDAVDLTITERLNKIKGRKAIVLFTDGVDTSSQQATYQSTLREVEELDALIYPIQYDTTDYLRAMQGAGSGSVTVVTTRRGLFGTTTTQQTYNVPLNNGIPLPGSTKADYDRADQYLHSLADKTGGRLYQANDNAQLAQAFTRIAEELRRQYSLGYYPKTDNVQGDGRRQIRVRVRQPNLAVKARDGYVKSLPAGPKQ